MDVSYTKFAVYSDSESIFEAISLLYPNTILSHCLNQRFKQWDLLNPIKR